MGCIHGDIGIGAAGQLHLAMQGLALKQRRMTKREHSARVVHRTVGHAGDFEIALGKVGVDVGHHRLIAALPGDVGDALAVGMIPVEPDAADDYPHELVEGGGDRLVILPPTERASGLGGVIVDPLG